MAAQYFEVLLRLLERDPAVDALVGPRVLTELPQEPVYPCILLRLPSRQTIQTLSGPTSCGTARPVVDCLSDDFTEAWKLEEAVRNALDGFQGTIDGCELQHVVHVNSQDFPYDPDTGEEFPLRSKRMTFDVFHSQSVPVRLPTPDAPAGPPVDPPPVDPPPVDPLPPPPDPSDPPPPPDPSDPVPAWPALVPSGEMVEQYGDNAAWDVGALGNLTYATPAAFWFADVWNTWYYFPGDGTVSNATSGLPNGRAIFQGTLNRLGATRPGSSIKFYTTLLRVRTEASFMAAGAWPRTGAIQTSDYLPSWLNPSYNTPGDAWPEEKGIAYKIADCRDLHGREWARTVAEMKGLHPQINGVFSDNFAMPQVAPTLDWTALCLLAGRANHHQRQTFKVALPLTCNVTTRWHGNLAADLDLAANNEIAGWHNEGITHEHFMTVAEFNNIRDNIRYWCNKPWPGGGHRYFATNARIEANSGLPRVVNVASVNIAGSLLEVTCATPHRLSDTSLWNAFPIGVHPSLNGVARGLTRVSDTVFTINFAPGVPPASGYSAGQFCFTYSGREVDAGFLHSIRNSTHNIRVQHVHGGGDPRGYATPLWRTWAATYGYATGNPQIVSTHTVSLVPYGASGSLNCVKEIRTPFAGGWYLHVDFSLAERRAWWNLGS